ncbi:MULTISPECIES: transposase [unclassified Chryseobacterium]|uniref:transposase n=1 Tax=unclassified Chryseobacterium TaxID=2593645 RepID=UPI00100B99D0|nr:MULTISPECIES: transposase [unclassified Chryseobacterium]RXM50558.1 transposase [Chryseobacterium sp. CH25]RXM63194.1 transposase [Chryseobacterium sp. CH1]
MSSNFKNIHIGQFIHLRVQENGIDLYRICNFMKCTEPEIFEMYSQEHLPTNILLRWSKILEYDFFRLYSQHLILYAPPSASIKEYTPSKLPQFRKNIYTKEMIDFILEVIEKEEKTKRQITDEYGIPYTTVCKWIAKHNK